jgi:hypothetical protein
MFNVMDKLGKSPWEINFQISLKQFTQAATKYLEVKQEMKQDP